MESFGARWSSLTAIPVQNGKEGSGGKPIRQRISSRFPFPKQEWVSPHHSPCADPQKESIHQTQYKRVTLAKLIGMTSVPEKHYLSAKYVIYSVCSVIT